jgi:two-component system sensor histidine kinase HydH
MTRTAFPGGGSEAEGVSRRPPDAVPGAGGALPAARRLYFPAIAIVVVVLLLLVFIGVSTYRNLDRARANALRFVHNQGVAMLRALEAGARTWVMTQRWHEGAIARLVEEMGRGEDIAFLYLADADGTIVHHSNPLLDGKPAPWTPDIPPGAVASRLRSAAEGAPLYEIAKRFAPFSGNAGMRHGPMGMHGGMGHHAMAIPEARRDMRLVLGLTMATYEEARAEDLHHAGIMAAILVALAGGAVFFIFVIHRYHRVNQDLRLARDYTRQVVDGMANGLVSTDPGGRVLTFNQLAVELLGVSGSDLWDSNIAEWLDPDASGLRRTLDAGEAVLDREITHRTPAGASVPLSISVTPLPGPGASPQGAVLLLRDLREIKRLEARVRRHERLAALGRMAASVAHEIRNPLSSIRGFAQFLGHQLRDRPRDQEYAGIMVKEIDRINGVVTDLLTFARPLETEPVPTDPAELIDHTLRLVEGDAAARQVTLRREVGADMGAVGLDANQMTQVLLNLCLNALQSVSEGGTVTVGAGRNEGVRFWVSDDGPGIPEADRRRIFDPFFTTREKGTGLGLAIVQKIAEAHGGEVRIESPDPASGHGCRFTVHLPDGETTAEPAEAGERVEEEAG